MSNLQINLFIEAIDVKNIETIKFLTENLSKNNKHIDIIFEIYNQGLLTLERLKFIVETCSSFLNVSLALVKQLLKEDNFELLDIIFIRNIFFDKESILNLLCFYENKKAISTIDWNQFVEKYKISTIKNYDVMNNYYYSSRIYLINAFEEGKYNLVKYLIELGIDINITNRMGETLLFNICKNGNLYLAKYLI